MKKLIYLTLVIILAAGGVLWLVSCGSSSTNTTISPGGGLQTSPPPGGTTGPDFKPVAVDIKDFAFSPVTVTVAIGTTVTWTNEDSSTHTIVSQSGGFNSGDLSKGATFSHTFTAAGDFEYHCSIHPSMVGHITVSP